MLSIIVAAGTNNVIGRDNGLIWHMPNDLRFFKEKTSGHTIIMGRKTFDSMGRPLPNRRNIVITRDAKLKIAGCDVVGSLQEALALCKGEEETFIVGGEEIYRQSLPLADRVYLTRIDHVFEGDRHFPALGDDWILVDELEGIVDDRNSFPHSFQTFERIKVRP
jgi:dihydrofolate reductase